MKRKLILLTLLLAFSIPYMNTLQASEISPKQPSDWVKGDGGSIHDLAELLWLTENTDAWSEDWILEADIDASETETWNDGQGLSPIGDSPTEFGVRQQIPFTGTFDGQNYEISYVYINRPTEPYVGFFGQTIGGEVKNLNLVDCNIEGNKYVGGLIGYSSEESVIDNCIFDGKVVGNQKITGGLIGQVYDHVSISNSHSSGTVYSEKWVGGLVGDNYNYSNIIKCSSSSVVTGVDYIGGLAGSNRWYSNIDKSYATGDVTSIEGEEGEKVGGLVGYQKDGIVMNCFSTSKVEGFNRVGGLVGGGLMDDNSGAYVANSYATGKVSGSYNVGGFIGHCYIMLHDVYFDKETSGTDIGVGNDDNGGQFATGLISMQFSEETSFNEWDFENTWTVGIISEISPMPHPYLQWQPIVTDYFTLNFVAGEGGTVDGETYQVVFPGESSSAVTAVPDEGYFFVEWKDSEGATVSTETELVIDDVAADGDYTAIFTPMTFELNFVAAEGGSITGETTQTVIYGEASTPVTAVADPVYAFDEWQNADGEMVSEEATLVIENVMQSETYTAIFHSTVGVADVEDGATLKFYPNPATSFITIETDEPVEIKIYNLEGKVVLESKISSVSRIDINHLNTGVYIIQQETKGVVTSHKLVKK